MTDSWKKLPLAEFARTGSGGTPNRSESRFYENGTIPWVKSGELRRFRIDDTEEKITPEALASSSAKLVPKGAILIALYGATVGQCSILEIDAATNQAVCSIAPDERICKQRFLYYYLISIKQYLLGQRAGGAQPNISQALIKALEIPLPALAEQDRIVEILDQADAIRQQRRQADALSQRILPALFQEMFGDPQTQTIKSGKRLGDYITDSNYGLSAKADEDASGIPILRMNNVTYEGHLDLESLKYLSPHTPNLKRSMLRKGDLLFNRTNSRELVGKTALWGPDIQAVAASYLIVFRVNETKLLPEFVWAYMNSRFFKDLLLNTARKAIGMANINSKEIAAFPIWTPPLERQMKFKEALHGIENSRQNQATSAATLETLFQTLLHRAFDGSLTAKWREGHAKEVLQEMNKKTS